MRYQGLLYRCINPVFAAEPLSGRGAKLYGGRFNAKGVAALYTSLSIETAIREANQAGSLQPTLMVSYAADLRPVFDATVAANLLPYGMTPVALAADDWRDQMRAKGRSDTQEFAAALVRDGFVGMVVPSFAAGVRASDLNMVLWEWQRPGARIALVDDEGRLGLREAGHWRRGKLG